MKATISIYLFILLIITGSVSAQDSNKITVIIQTSAQCEQCKTRIEKALAFERGVVNSNLDLETKAVTIEYKKGKTTLDALRKAIAAVGYDADEVKADEKAYAALPGCCKKPDDPDHVDH
jgi:cation transport ATPase